MVELLEDVIGVVEQRVGGSLAPEDCRILQGFISSYSGNTLYIIKRGGSGVGGGKFEFSEDLSQLEQQEDAEYISILVKPVGKVENANQINVLNFTVGRTTNETFENIRMVINYGITPYFDMISSSESSGSVIKARSKLNELALSLQHLQQKIQIPDLLMSTHPTIESFLEGKVSEQELVGDSVFLNELTSRVSGWVRQIQSITNLDHGPLDGASIMDEIQFWKSMETAINSIESQIATLQVRSSIEILNKARRYHITLTFQNDTGISAKSAEANLFNTFLKDLPVDNLFIDQKEFDLEHFDDLISDVFSHFKKLRNLNSFPLTRAISLTEVVLNDVVGRLALGLSLFNLMSMPFTDFVSTYNEVVLHAFHVIESKLKIVVNLFRELLRKRRSKFFIIKINQDRFDDLKRRLTNMYTFRLRHHDLLSISSNVLEDTSAQTKLIESYDTLMLQCDLLDLQPHSQRVWTSNESLYSTSYKLVEESIVKDLGFYFSNCHDFNDCISLFEKFEIAHSNSHLSHLINDEYKIKVIELASSEIDSLINVKLEEVNELMGGYLSQDSTFLEIIWSINLTNKVRWYTNTLTSLLGDSWKRYAVGSLLNSTTNGVLDKIDTERSVQSWLNQMASSVTITGPVLLFNTVPDNDLQVNYNPRTTEFSLHCKQLVDMGYKIPMEFIIKVQKIDQIYPLISNIEEYINVFKDIMEKGILDTRQGKRLGFLLTDRIESITRLIPSILSINWTHLVHALDLQIATENEDVYNSSNLVEVKSFNTLKSLENDIEELIIQWNQLEAFYDEVYNKEIPKLMSCSYDNNSIAEILRTITVHSNKLNLASSIDMTSLFHILNTDLTTMLIEKCNHELGCILPVENLIEVQTSRIQYLEHVLDFDDIKLTISPPTWHTRKAIYQKVSRVLRIVGSQRMLAIKKDDPVTFENEVASNSKIQHKLSGIMDSTDEIIHECNTYFKKWKILQTLWELDVNTEEGLNQLISDPKDISSWLESISQLGVILSLFDTHESGMIFGNIVKVDSTNVKTKARLKFDTFILAFTKRFSEEVKLYSLQIYEDIKASSARVAERMDMRSSFRKLLVHINSFILVSNFKDLWIAKLSILEKTQESLFKLKFKFPQNWLYVEEVENKFSSLEQLLLARKGQIEKDISTVKKILELETSSFNSVTKEFELSWNNEKPTRDVEPRMALSQLDRYMNKCKKLSDVYSMICNVESYLGLPQSVVNELSDIQSEASDLRRVWITIEELNQCLLQFNGMKWSEVLVKTLQDNLNHLSTRSRDVSANIRMFPAFIKISGRIKYLQKSVTQFRDLKSEAMKKRHWNALFSRLGKKVTPIEQLTLEDIWNLDLELNNAIIQSILQQAYNEKALEDKLSEILKLWSDLAFETFAFKNKCRLVKNWEKILDQCSSSLETLSSMRNSPYYSIFEHKINDIEEKLNKLSLLFDTWIDVQQQWTYLDDIFCEENEEIRRTLPLEYSRFDSISFQFMDLSKRVYKYSTVIEVLSVRDIQDSMSKLLDSFIKVRKSLTNYLEKQRELFPRFYFLGDEDLLEIIGASFDLSRTNKHLQKMFSGISSIIYDIGTCVITGITSDQGEKLTLKNQVSLIQFQHLHEWMQQLELEVKLSLAHLIKENFDKFRELYEKVCESTDSLLLELLEVLPAQVSTVLVQLSFTEGLELAIKTESIKKFASKVDILLQRFSDYVTQPLSRIMRLKAEQLIIELIHQREIVTKMENALTFDEINYHWQTQQLYYYDKSSSSILESVKIVQAGCEFLYGFEYQGISEKLAYTPLIDSCFLAMTQALDKKLGGNPFGPAGTGKTESIKALAKNFGKMVIVFCCDESFDFQAMCRIFLGICKIGCWVCFDEFNRLELELLSAVSSQIESIELGLSKNLYMISLSGRDTSVHPESGLFVTMNPGYAGRSELPENLKRLFIPFSMNYPNLATIAEVLLASQGFKDSKRLSKLMDPFYQEIASSVSKQLHYDFGLRSLKNTLLKCGQFKRLILVSNKTDTTQTEDSLILRSLEESIRPKLVEEDEIIFQELLQKYFQSVRNYDVDLEPLKASLEEFCAANGYLQSSKWIAKALQLFQVQSSHCGIMLVGNPGSGKTTLWRLVLQTLSRQYKSETLSFVIDAKVMTKENLFGRLDPITREWTDGLFTSILRRVEENLRGEIDKITWVIFDGDIDPDWAETLNSVLDDNRVLTLPNGERLCLPDNMTLIFEVDSLKYTTPATVSRCGMLWVDSNTVDSESLLQKYLFDLKVSPKGLIEDNPLEATFINTMHREMCSIASEILTHGYVSQILSISKTLNHVMDFSNCRALSSIFSLLQSYMKRALESSIENQGLPVDLNRYMLRAIFLSCIWALAGDCSIRDRQRFVTSLQNLIGEEIIDAEVASESVDFFGFDISLPQGDWVRLDLIIDKETKELEIQDISNPSIIVPTIDTIKHEALIYSLIKEHKTLLLCGPPGSGKTMSLFDSLRKSPTFDVISLNFSKDSSPESLIKSMNQSCVYRRTSNGVVMVPKVEGKWVVVFCDEINLPSKDKYETQRLICFMRQMIEHQGFWDQKSKHWVSLVNIQFVGACNPPNVPGRNVLSNRFLRHTFLLMVDYPGEMSLTQIYGSFNKAVLKCAPSLRGFASPITRAMIEVYLRTKEKLDHTIQAHYVYSPRELTRWCRGILEGLKAKYYDDLQEFIKLWLYEGMRLFYDRLVCDEERKWTVSLFEDTLENNFPNFDKGKVYSSPLLFSSWLSLKYELVDYNELQSFVSERLRVFSEEELDVNLVLYQDFLDHTLRIDRVLRQPQGHMILVGPSGSGRTTLGKFVAWVNGLKVVCLNVTRKYSLNEFDDGLRIMLLRCTKGEKICFMIDESNILLTAFIERMNTLLANAEIPGLFEGDDFSTLMQICRGEANSRGLFLESDDELYNWFKHQISQNLHVIFTLNDLKDDRLPNTISSPALFNRCVLNWMGDWSDKAIHDLVFSRIENVPLDQSTYIVPRSYKLSLGVQVTSLREVIADILLFIHRADMNYSLPLDIRKTPSNVLNLVGHFVRILNEKRVELDELQRHTMQGLDKLKETVLQVNTLKQDLSKKKDELTLKDNEAREMLNKMLTDQNEAERRQEFSVATQEELIKQEKEIEKRKFVVLRDLELAEPAILEAQRGVQNIKKQHLTEIRSMSNPPDVVKLIMESVCVLLGFEVSSWRDVQLVIRRDDFIASIVNYNNEDKLTPEIKKFMEETYLSRKQYTFESANRASKACGPLLLWVKAQITYSSVLENVGPLKDEVSSLEDRTRMAKAQLIAIDEMIEELQEGIEQSKTRYSQLIRDTELIKQEMTTVEAKVTRSVNLIDNLTTERERWKNTVTKFKHQKGLLVGDSILCASFLVYSGVYDQKGRILLMDKWKNKLIEAEIPFDESVTMFLVLENSKTIYMWQNNGLPNDDINIENFAIINSTSIPLLIDPSALIIGILGKCFSPRKPCITSFLNDKFIKQVENEVRFGGVVIIQDAEHYDSVLDPLLRHDVQKTGGRSVIKLDGKEIDYSPKFKLIFHTRNASLNCSTFVAARTTVCNFTVTKGSIENMVINTTLRERRPDLESKRIELTHLNNEFRVRLYKLEEDLLNVLSESKDNILESNDLLIALESLKSEASDIDGRMESSTSLIKDIEKVKKSYTIFAHHSSKIFSALELLQGLNLLYHFLLDEYLSTFVTVLQLKTECHEYEQIIESLYQEVFFRVSPRLVMQDKIIFAIVLANHFYSWELGLEIDLLLMSCLKSIAVEGFEIDSTSYRLFDESNQNDKRDVGELSCRKKERKHLVLDISSKIHEALSKDNQDIKTCLNHFEKLASSLFKQSGYGSRYSLVNWANHDIGHGRPIILASSDKNDATKEVKSLAKEYGVKLALVSMGSEEVIKRAEREIKTAAQNGHWVLVQNIQMAPLWLNHLGKLIDNLPQNDKFNIFMTCNLKSYLPTELASRSSILIFESESNFKTTVAETFSFVQKSSSALSFESFEFRHASLILSWFHSIILTRLKYSPFSFEKRYDINESDLLVCLKIVDKQLSSQPTANSSNSVPWKVLSFLIGEIIYGGKVDGKQDKHYITNLASQLFQVECLDFNFNLFQSKGTESCLNLPEESSYDLYRQWIESLDEDPPLSWFGMSDDVDKLHNNRRGKLIASSALKFL